MVGGMIFHHGHVQDQELPYFHRRRTEEPYFIVRNSDAEVSHLFCLEISICAAIF